MRVVLAVFALFLLSGCATQGSLNPYYSTAAVGASTSVVHSSLLFVSGSDEKTVLRPYGVVAAGSIGRCDPVQGGQAGHHEHDQCRPTHDVGQ